jgi:hypothetical protein
MTFMTSALPRLFRRARADATTIEIDRHVAVGGAESDQSRVGRIAVTRDLTDAGHRGRGGICMGMPSMDILAVTSHRSPVSPAGSAASNAIVAKRSKVEADPATTEERVRIVIPPPRRLKARRIDYCYRRIDDTAGRSGKQGISGRPCGAP